MNTILLILCNALSCFIISTILFQFMNGKYKRSSQNRYVYIVVETVTVIFTTCINMFNHSILNLVVWGVLTGIIVYVLYYEDIDKPLRRIIECEGVPTTVSVSSAFLQKCMNDPEKAKYLEENLAAIPDCAKSAVNGCLGTLTNLSYKVDENGNISVAISGTNDPDGKIAKENAERKAKENREKEEKIKEKRAAKKAEEEKAAKKRAEKSAERKETGDYTLSVTGNDVKSMTQSLVAESVSISAPDRSSFDIKA